MLRGVSTFASTFLTTTFLGFKTGIFFLTTFFLVGGFLALVLDLLAVLAVFFFFVEVDVFVRSFLPAVVVAFLVGFLFVVGNARGVLREKKRGRAATMREGTVAGDDDKVGSRPTRFVSVLRGVRRARVWRTNTENMVEGVTALGWKKTKPRCYFDNWGKQWNKYESLFCCDQISRDYRCRWLGLSHPLFARSACCVAKRAQPRRGPGQSSCVRLRKGPGANEAHRDTGSSSSQHIRYLRNTILISL